MGEIAQTAFARVQRLSTDWHANNFAGSTVRRVTRGMWGDRHARRHAAADAAAGDVRAAGTTVVLALRWPLMGLLLGLASIGFAVVSVLLTLNYVAPSARLANVWDTRMGAALADAITCNGVVKAFGAERREDARLARVVDRWAGRTARTWIRRHRQRQRAGSVPGGAADRPRRRRAAALVARPRECRRRRLRADHGLPGAGLSARHRAADQRGAAFG